MNRSGLADHMFLAAVAMVVLAAVPAFAQTLVEPLPGAATRAGSKPQARTVSAARPCPEYGPGFVRMDNGLGCVRLSGAVRAEYGARSGRGGVSTGSSTGAVVRAETRTETSFGELRTVVQGRGQIGRNLESGSFR